MRIAWMVVVAGGLTLVTGACGKSEPAATDDVQAQATAAPVAGTAGADASAAGEEADEDEVAGLPEVPDLALNRPGMLGDDDGAPGADDGVAPGGPAELPTLPPEQRATREACEKAADQMNVIMLTQAKASVPPDAGPEALAELETMAKQRFAAQRPEFIDNCLTSMPKEAVACLGAATDMQSFFACAQQGMAADAPAEAEPLTAAEEAAFGKALDHQEKILDLIEANKGDAAAAGKALASYVEANAAELKQLEVLAAGLQGKLQANPQAAMQLIQKHAERMQSMSQRLNALGPTLQALSENAEARAALEKIQLAP